MRKKEANAHGYKRSYNEPASRHGLLNFLSDTLAQSAERPRGEKKAMFTTREFVKSGLLDAIGHQPDYKVIIDASDWCEKGTLTTDDLEEIQTAIDAHNAASKAAAEEEKQIRKRLLILL